MSSALDPLVRNHPELGPAVTTLHTLATALPEVTLPDGVPHRRAAQARLAAAMPALEGETLLDGTVLLANVHLLATALGPTGETARSIAQELERIHGGVALDELAAAAQSGAWDLVSAWAVRAGLEPDAVITLIDHAARPALRAGARAVHELVTRSDWKRGTCPACGAAPLLAELRGSGASVGGVEQERVLRCGRCLTAWSFLRGRCVSCGETNHQRLAYLHGAGEGTFRRADVCSTCNGYLKSIAVLAPLTLVELLEVDLATAALDLGAVERGFHR